MYIEILDSSQHCPVKCTTCPDSVRRLSGSHAESIPIVFSLLMKMLGSYPLNVSFVNYAQDIPSKISKYGITNPKILTCPLSVTSDAAADEMVVRELHKILPTTDLHFGFNNKNNVMTKKMFDKAEMLGNFFKEVNLGLVKLSITDNSCSAETYRNNRIAYMKKDALFRDQLAAQIQIPLKSWSSYKKTPEMYFSQIYNNDKKHVFLVTRRVMVEVLSNTNSNFSDFAMSYLRKGYISDPCHLYLTLTPMGIRLHHIAWDIRNPYMWISYGEMFMLLERSTTIEDFCTNLALLVNKSLLLKFDEDFPITQESLEHKAALQNSFK